MVRTALQRLFGEARPLKPAGKESGVTHAQSPAFISSSQAPPPKVPQPPTTGPVSGNKVLKTSLWGNVPQTITQTKNKKSEMSENKCKCELKGEDALRKAGVLAGHVGQNLTGAQALCTGNKSWDLTLKERGFTKRGKRKIMYWQCKVKQIFMWTLSKYEM